MTHNSAVYLNLTPCTFNTGRPASYFPEKWQWKEVTVLLIRWLY